MAVKPIPEGFHTITPYLVVNDAAGLIEFLKNAFDASVIRILIHENGKVGNAELKIGTSMIMVADGSAESRQMPLNAYLYVEDVDAVYEKAVAAGGNSLMAPVNMFYGDRNCGVQDKWGNCWWIATRIEEFSDEEIERRDRERKKK